MKKNTLPVRVSGDYWACGLDMYPLHGPLKPHGLCSPGSLNFWEVFTHAHTCSPTWQCPDTFHKTVWPYEGVTPAAPCERRCCRFQAYKRTFNQSHMLLNVKCWCIAWKKWEKCKICSLRSSRTHQMTANPSHQVHHWLMLLDREVKS